MHNRIMGELVESMKAYILHYGVYLQIRKKGHHFVITQAKGDRMMQDLHIPKEKYVGISSKDYHLYMPEDVAIKKVAMLQKVWQEDNLLAIYKGVANDVNYYSLLNPIYRKGRIVHMEAYMFFSKEILEEIEEFMKMYRVNYEYCPVAM